MPSVVAAQGFTPDDTKEAIVDASLATGVPAARLYRVVGCETGGTFSPYAEGDWVGRRPTSHGPVQLHDGGNAEATFFRYYTDPYDPYQAVQFMAEALAGQYAHLGAWTWSCK